MTYEYGTYVLPKSGYKVEFRRKLGFYEFRMAEVEVPDSILGSMINSIYDSEGGENVWAPVHSSLMKDALAAFDS